MRRALLITALAGAALAALPAVAQAQQLKTSVRVVECSFEQHQAIFRGSMRSIEGSARMAMRFTLLERTGADGFRPLKAAGLGRWRRAKPGVVSFGYRQVVRALPENAVYRMRVDFRWSAADGSVLAQVQRNSPSCRQYSALPNLKVEVLGASATKVAGVVRYRVLVTNDGRAEVSAPVQLSVDGGRHGERHPLPRRVAAARLSRAHLYRDRERPRRPRRHDRRELGERQRGRARLSQDGSARPVRSGKQLSRRYDEDGERPPVH
jgi:hypothetical protein